MESEILQGRDSFRVGRDRMSSMEREKCLGEVEAWTNRINFVTMGATAR